MICNPILAPFNQFLNLWLTFFLNKWQMDFGNVPRNRIVIGDVSGSKKSLILAYLDYDDYTYRSERSPILECLDLEQVGAFFVLWRTMFCNILILYYNL